MNCAAIITEAADPRLRTQTLADLIRGNLKIRGEQLRDTIFLFFFCHVLVSFSYIFDLKLLRIRSASGSVHNLGSAALVMIKLLIKLTPSSHQITQVTGEFEADSANVVRKQKFISC